MAILLALLLAGGWLWLSLQDRENAYELETARADLSAQAMVSSLRSIMLAGHGDMARTWMADMAEVEGVESVHIYRTNGQEAFKDGKTIERVNEFLGGEQFSQPSYTEVPGTIPDELEEPFYEVHSGQQERVRILKNDRLTYLMPIKTQTGCMVCHGYDNDPQRGVLVLTISTARSQAMSARTEAHFAWISGAIVLAAWGIAWLLLRVLVLVPLEDLARTARRVQTGDLGARATGERLDEFGEVATAFNDLIGHLHGLLAHEQTLRERQEGLTEAILSLNQEMTGKTLLYRIAALAQSMTGAQYAMLAYLEGDKRVFLPVGLSDEEVDKIGHWPEGKGLLGLLWNEKRIVRLPRLQAHPLSVGFPEGHPAMGSFLGSPIFFGDQILGVIYLTEKEGGGDFSSDDEEMLRVFAFACGMALANARHVESLAALNADLEARVQERTQALDDANQSLILREADLQRANEALQLANDAKDRFLASTSHELRTPLNAIIGFSELLITTAGDLLNEKQRRYLSHINVSGLRLLRIINDLLDISKIEAGMMQISSETIDPTALLHQVASEMEPLAQAKSIALNFEVSSAAEQTSWASDKGKVHQVLVNLIGNAVKFTPDQGRIDCLLSLQTVGGRPAMQVMVSDTGVGIEQEHLERIFDEFYQVDGAPNQSAGTGLGLALTRRIVRLLGGDIVVSSQPGEGTTFTFHMPLHPPEQHIVEESRHAY